MKKRIISITLIVAVIACSLFSTTAFAQDQTNMSAVVDYRVFDVPESTTPKYEVVIPSPTLLNQSNKVPITLSSNFLTPDEILNISLDPSTFAPDGYLHLMSDKSDFLKAEIQRAGRSDTEGEKIDAVNGPFVVAKFDNSSLNPVEYGSVIVKVIDDGTAPPNSYTGYLHFTFELSTKN